MKKDIASFFLLIAIAAIDIAIRHNQPWDVFDYGNITCLILLGIASILVSKDSNIAVSFFTTIVMASLLYDKVLGKQWHVQVNDVVIWAIGAAAGMIYYKRYKPKLAFDGLTLLILLIPVVKIFSDNTTYKLVFAGRERDVFVMLNSVTHFLFALYIFLQIVKEPRYRSVSILFLTLTVNDMVDNILGDPDYTHPGEVLTFSGVATVCLWWELKRRFGRDEQSRKLFNHILIAFAAIVFAFIIITLFSLIFHVKVYL